ncbi:hypothetical protein HYU95_04430 [Candidatus Daviesbacteria bacterium]|nr:hypothetical protein [Candidatus Daviesbacteria bacterium]
MLPRTLIIALILIVSFVGLGLFFHNNPEIVQKIKPAGPAPWESQSTTSCPDPLVLQTPVDLSKVTSILYPGQVRGGDFKPHGGFRFDNSKVDEIEVRAPMDAKFTEGSRYIEQGEVQYLFDFQTSCGIRFRFDHLLVLAPKFAEAVKNLPNPKEHDSQTTRVNPAIDVKKGEVIATAVGLKSNNNVFVDFGVYDMRGKFFTGPRDNAVCWFDLLPSSDSARVKSLPPADSKSGSQSTLCKL